MQHAFPVIQVLPTEGKIEAVGMTGGLISVSGRAFPQHLQDRVAGHQVNQQEDERTTSQITGSV